MSPGPRGAPPVAPIPGPVPEDRTLIVTKPQQRVAEKSPEYVGSFTRGGETFAVFSKKPSDAIIKAVKDTK